MKNEKLQNETITQMVMLPREKYEKLNSMVEEIYGRLCENNDHCPPKVINGYISEKDAKEMTGRKTTWFWERRKSGKLPHKKLGATVYYKMDDLELLFD